MLGHRSVVSLGWVGLTWAFLVLLPSVPSLHAQTTATVRGTVTRADDGTPLRRALVNLRGTTITVATDRNGQYVLQRVPAGEQTLVVRWLGFRRRELSVTVTAGGSHTVDAALEPEPVVLADVVVEGVSRTPERIVEAPAAVSVVDPVAARDLAATSQPARAFTNLPGVDVVQNDMNDYNVNSRGFNSSFSRRVLVLQDGRDLAIPFLGAQEWYAMTIPIDQMSRVEFVRGPGSALYGVNAYSGVINFITPSAREIVGTKLNLGGGNLSSSQGDVAHAGVFGDGRFGYKLNLGYNRSSSWSVSRTSADSLDQVREYAPASDIPAPKGIEAVPLLGQTLDPTTRTAVGDPDPISNTYGSGRFDYYLDDGSVVTAEGGAALVQNATFVAGLGRIQVDKATRPWARVALASNRIYAQGWYTGRNAIEPQISLASGLPIDDKSSVFHGEAQYNQRFLSDRGRFVIGGSARSFSIDSKTTLVAPENDNRTDWYASAFGQVEYDVVSRLRLVATARYDDSNLFEAQFSPKAAVVYSPNPRHAIRLTYNHGFQTPNQLEFFLSGFAGAPADFTLLEQGLRASPLGPALAGVPDGELFTNSSVVPVLASGNQNLEVETIKSVEAGYKGQLTNRVFVTADVYYSQLSNFVTDILPGVNPAFLAWSAPEAVPAPARAPLEQAVQETLVGVGQPLAAAGLTNLPDGSTAIMFSYANAGDVDEYGVELGLGIQMTAEVNLLANYSFFEFDIDSTTVIFGDLLIPNTPKHKGNIALSYVGARGLDVRAAVNLVDSFDWAAGIFTGNIPSRQFVDLSASYEINPYLRIYGIGTNLLDQPRYQFYGGSVTGIRVLGGVAVTY